MKRKNRVSQGPPLDFRPAQMKYQKAFTNCPSHTEFSYDCHACLVSTVGLLTKLLDRVNIDEAQKGDSNAS